MRIDQRIIACFNAWYEIGVTTRRIKWFTYHLDRCKRLEDIVKLIALIILCVVYLNIKMNELNGQLKALNSQLFLTP